jgi:hypothetical protein
MHEHIICASRACIQLCSIPSWLQPRFVLSLLLIGDTCCFNLSLIIDTCCFIFIYDYWHMSLMLIINTCCFIFISDYWHMLSLMLIINICCFIFISDYWHMLLYLYFWLLTRYFTFVADYWHMLFYLCCWLITDSVLFVLLIFGTCCFIFFSGQYRYNGTGTNLNTNYYNLNAFW